MNHKPFYRGGNRHWGLRGHGASCAAWMDRTCTFSGAGSAESVGWEKSRIIDQQAVSRCVLEAVQQAEAMARAQIETITAGFGGLTVRGAEYAAARPISDVRARSSRRDVNRVMKSALRVALAEDRMVLQLLPQDFVVDDHPGTSRSAEDAGLGAGSQRARHHGVHHGA